MRQLGRWSDRIAPHGHNFSLCKTLRRACIDQGMFVLSGDEEYEGEEEEAEEGSSRAFRLNVHHTFPGRAGQSKEDVQVPDPVFRPMVSELEESRDLAYPKYRSALI